MNEKKTMIEKYEKLSFKIYIQYSINIRLINNWLVHKFGIFIF
jgi:hypothetical protein